MRVLAIGAHPDDIELGCGATLAAHRARGDEVALLVMTTGEQGPQAAASRVDEQVAASRRLGAELCWGSFDDCAVPDGRPSIELIEAVLAHTGADLVYTHSPNDTHQDHRATANATFAAARRLSRVLRYESPTTTSFLPSVYVDIDSYLDAKVDLICAHVSQVLKNGLVDVEAIRAQARYYGFRARLHLAEAFETDRFVWDVISPSELTDREVDLRSASDFDVAVLR